MDGKIKNLRGFTLIELLAVIVVLAIVMLIAVNAVLPQMERARRSSFAIEANGAIDAANAYFMNESITSGGTGFPAVSGGTETVPISRLISEGYSDLNPEEYSGCVQVTKGSGVNENLYFFKVWIKKGSSMVVVGAGTNDDGDANEAVTEDDVQDYVAPVSGGTAGTWSTGYETCTDLS